MKFLSTYLFLSALVAVTVAERGNIRSQQDLRRLSNERKSSKSGSSDDLSSDDNKKSLTLTITNESFNQPFSPFFVMVHNSHADPLYVRGEPASEPLALLAENGNPSALVEYYTLLNNEGVGSATAFMEGAPYVGGEIFEIEVEISEEYPLVTVATMAINTNDCFTALNGVHLYPGQVLDVPGLDAGSEENNESCDSIPGPGCQEINTDNVRSGNGEGFVHVHRGFFGIGDLAADRYDWRNPMMRIVVGY